MTLETAQKIARLQRELLDAYEVDWSARSPARCSSRRPRA